MNESGLRQLLMIAVFTISFLTLPLAAIARDFHRADLAAAFFQQHHKGSDTATGTASEWRGDPEQQPYLSPELDRFCKGLLRLHEQSLVSTNQHTTSVLREGLKRALDRGGDTLPPHGRLALESVYEATKKSTTHCARLELLRHSLLDFGEWPLAFCKDVESAFGACLTFLRECTIERDELLATRVLLTAFKKLRANEDLIPNEPCKVAIKVITDVTLDVEYDDRRDFLQSCAKIMGLGRVRSLHGFFKMVHHSSTKAGEVGKIVIARAFLTALQSIEGAVPNEMTGLGIQAVLDVCSAKGDPYGKGENAYRATKILADGLNDERDFFRMVVDSTNEIRRGRAMVLWAYFTTAGNSPLIDGFTRDTLLNALEEARRVSTPKQIDILLQTLEGI